MRSGCYDLVERVTNKEAYIVTLQKVIRNLHGCDSTHVATVPVHEVYQGQTVWRAEVEVFDLKGHAKAKRCYAWSHLDKPDDSEERFVAVLEIPPVVSPESAVRVSIVADAKAALKHQTDKASDEIARRNRKN